MSQGRQTEWLPEQLGISRNYLYRMRLKPSNPMFRHPQDGLWAKIERVLGVPEGTIEYRDEHDRTVAEQQVQFDRLTADQRKRDYDASRHRVQRFQTRIREAVAATA